MQQPEISIHPLIGRLRCFSLQYKTSSAIIMLGSPTALKDAYYISVNSEYQFLPEFIEDKGIAILGDIGTVLKDLLKAKEESAFV